VPELLRLLRRHPLLPLVSAPVMLCRLGGVYRRIMGYFIRLCSDALVHSRFVAGCTTRPLPSHAVIADLCLLILCRRLVARW
jgi:hypothetical protein